MSLDWGKLGEHRNTFIGFTAIFALITIVGLISVMNAKPEETGPGYSDVFSSEEELAAKHKVLEELAAKQEVDAEGKPTEAAKLKVLESLGAQ
ncbi:MAG: hypothetical protein AAB605_03620 [Patescibacteria group bacterium]